MHFWRRSRHAHLISCCLSLPVSSAAPSAICSHGAAAGALRSWSWLCPCLPACSRCQVLQLGPFSLCQGTPAPADPACMAKVLGPSSWVPVACARACLPSIDTALPCRWAWGAPGACCAATGMGCTPTSWCWGRPCRGASTLCQQSSQMMRWALNCGAHTHIRDYGSNALLSGPLPCVSCAGSMTRWRPCRLCWPLTG